MMFASGLVARFPSSARASPILCSSREILREIGNDASGEGDVAGFDRDARVLGERLDDWQKGIGRESGRFVGLGVDDGRKLGHNSWF